MAGLINFKHLILYILIIIFLVIYLIFWQGLSESYVLESAKIKKFGCYTYSSENDIKNIARNNIIETFDENALKQQRLLKVTHYPPDQWNNRAIVKVGGIPNGILKAILLSLFSTHYTHPITVTYELDATDNCLVLKSILYQKN